MRNEYGTRMITGLNVADGPHLIAEHELVESYNGWTDQDGVWRSARGPEILYSGYDNIIALAAGRMGGVDHIVWLDDGDLYDNGSNVGSITAGDPMDIVPTDDGFLILGAAKNYIWDGTHLREQGAWQPDYIWSVNETAAGSTVAAPTITAVSLANPCVVTLNNNQFRVGDRVYITGITGTTELNDRYFTVSAATTGAGGTITLEKEDATSHTAWTSGGTVNGQTNLAGTYRFYYTQTLALGDGTVLESRPRGLLIESDTSLTIEHYNLGPTDTREASAITLSAGDYVLLGQTHDSTWEARFYFVKDGTSLFDINGTAGTDYYRGVRIYRTKADGYDYYLEREYTEADADCTTFTDGTSSGIELPAMYVGIPDNELGAVYLPGEYDHDSAPQADIGAPVGQRVFLASGRNVYWSSLDGIEYYNQSTGFERFPDVVTALGTWRNYCVVFSADRLWLMEIASDGLPVITEVPTPVGTTYPLAMATTDDGLFFLRDDGLWVFNGSRVVQVALEAFDSIVTPTSVTAAGNVLFVSGAEKSYVGISRRGRVVWHESEHFMPYADSTSGKIYSANTYQVYQMFVGRRAGGRLTTKQFGGPELRKFVRARVDMEGSTAPTLWLNGNIQTDYDGHRDPTNPGDSSRRIVWYSLPRYNNEYVSFSLDTTGDIKIYGIFGEESR